MMVGGCLSRSGAVRIKLGYLRWADIKNLQAGIAFQEKMTIGQKHLLLRALELDEEPLICTDDVFG